MLIPARHLIDRLRQPRSRSDELRALRSRLAEAARSGGPRERRLADELRGLRARLSRLLGTLTSCAGCSEGCPLPAGRWSGGHCCSGSTEVLFSDDEVAALALAGTTPGSLVPPRSDHAGCAFRGPTGCSLAVADRPNRCVIYLCRDAARELHARGDLARVEAVVDQLSAAYEAFSAARAERLLDEILGEPALPDPA